MTKRLHDIIRYIIETTPGKTQRGLAEHMGLNPAAVNRMLYGRRNIMVDEIPVIEDYLGVKLDIRMGAPANDANDAAPMPRRGFSDRAAQALQPSDAPPQILPPVPVFKDVRGSETVDWVPRHALQMGVRDAYALYVPSDDMAPRYFRDEVAYVQPGRPVEMNRDCVIELASGEVLVRRLLERSLSKLSVQQFNPPRKYDIAAKDARAIYAIVGRG